MMGWLIALLILPTTSSPSLLPPSLTLPPSLPTVSALNSPKGANDPREHYLGLLYPSEEFKVYGYATNTRVKFIIVTENTTIQSRDTDIKMVCGAPMHVHVSCIL